VLRHVGDFLKEHISQLICRNILTVGFRLFNKTYEYEEKFV
jgi:hypothetical protein